jgi:hypothetical protein
MLFSTRNHDRTKSYYLAHALEIYFKDNANVTFDRSPVIKGVTLGNTFIGYHHGNCKIDDLPLLLFLPFLVLNLEPL